MSNTSAIIPTYNRAVLLKETIESVLAQSLAPAEILIVDDGSDDNTTDIVASFGEQVTFIQKPENKGKADSLNKAIDRATGEYVWIVDDDDLVEPEALAKLTSLLEQSPEAGFSYGRHDRFSIAADGTRLHSDTGYWRNCTSEDFLTATLEDFFVHQPGMLVRRSLYGEVGPFDTQLMRSQDYDMLIRLARAAPCVSTEEVIFHQRQHEGDRGQGSARFSSAERDEKWIAYDQKIFSRLQESLTLSEYLPRGTEVTDDATRRLALIQRGTVFGRKKLWAQAISDFTAAAGLGGSNLNTSETGILRRAFGSKYGCPEIIRDRSLALSLRKIGQCRPAGKPILKALARGLLWQIRRAVESGDLQTAATLAHRALYLLI
ncbi:MAG: hypothetical protein VR75_08695 [Hyphomonadaceae bacterium BRH_c29]|nr:MAG: hypothetical protein VR75_08695 [Hyphomonadaceae bacterium BRH_c29]